MKNRTKGALSMVLVGATTFSIASVLLAGPVFKQMTKLHPIMNIGELKKVGGIFEDEKTSEKSPVAADLKDKNTTNSANPTGEQEGINVGNKNGLSLAPTTSNAKTMANQPTINLDKVAAKVQPSLSSSKVPATLKSSKPSNTAITTKSIKRASTTKSATTQTTKAPSTSTTTKSTPALNATTSARPVKNSSANNKSNTGQKTSATSNHGQQVSQVEKEKHVSQVNLGNNGKKI